MKKNSKDDVPNFDLINDMDVDIVRNIFYEKFNEFANNCNRTSPTDMRHALTRKKYEVIEINAIDITSLTNDT